MVCDRSIQRLITQSREAKAGIVIAWLFAIIIDQSLVNNLKNDVDITSIVFGTQAIMVFIGGVYAVTGIGQSVYRDIGEWVEVSQP